MGNHCQRAKVWHSILVEGGAGQVEAFGGERDSRTDMTT